MKRTVAALMLCICTAGLATARDGPAEKQAVSPYADMPELLLAPQSDGRTRIVLPPEAERADVREFIAGIERVRAWYEPGGGKVDFAAIEWRSLQDRQEPVAGHAMHAGDRVALQDATLVAPPVLDMARGAGRGRHGADVPTSDASKSVDYTNQAGEGKGEGKLREINPPFPSVLWLLGVLLIALATISRRTASG